MFRIDQYLLVLALLLVVPSFAQELSDAEHLKAIHAKHEIDNVIAKGLSYLVSQQESTGKFRGSLPNTHTALACMALMAAGQIPGQSKYGDNLYRGVMYLVHASKKERGYFGKEGDARMYGHGIVTLALCEAYGMMEREEDNRAVKEALERALNVILASQSKSNDTKIRGGWRYEPKPNNADLSVTVWQILALRSAQNCQLDVPQESIDLALDYVRRTYDQGKKGFAYEAKGGNASAAMKTAGCVALLSLGANEDEADKAMMRASADFLRTHDPKGGSHYWYTCYYLATAANMLADFIEIPEGQKPWPSLFLTRLENTLVKMQQGNGEFPKHSGHSGGVYSTAFGVICLCVHYQYLPIYQE